jgi:esterase/lipase superfamily enzyme
MPQRQVFFATNRVHDPARGFADECCPPEDELMSGLIPCEAEADPVPEGHAGAPVLAEKSAAGLAATVDKWLATAAETGALPILYTHGFNHALPEAASRSLKICLWLEAGGAPPLLPLAFGWPSRGQGTIESYREDGRKVGQSGAALAKLIRVIAARRGPAQKVIYLAHSMGVRCTRYGMQAIAAAMPPAAELPVFAQAFLMAGDDEADVLDRPVRAPAVDATAGGLRPIAELARHVTLGVNRGDGTVRLISGTINGNHRIGTRGPLNPGDLPANVKVVDYSMHVLDHRPEVAEPDGGASINWVAHQYFRNAPRVRADLVAALREDTAPEAVSTRRVARPDDRFAISEIAGRLYPTS